MTPDPAPDESGRSSPTAIKSPRWRRRKDARPAEMLEAAFAVFAERGFAAARLDQVARRAGVTKGALYLYFDGKESLFEAMVRDRVARDAERPPGVAAEASGTAAEALVQFLEEWWETVAMSPAGPLARLVLGEAAQFPALAALYHGEVIGRRLKRIEHVLRLGMARGEFRRLDPVMAVKLGVLPLLAAALWTPGGDDAIAARAYFEAHVDLFLRGLAPDRG